MTTKKTPAPVEKPKRLTLSQIVEQLMQKGSVASSVTLTSNYRGEVQYEVTARAETLEEAEAQALAAYDRLHKRFPATPAAGSAKVELTRNAKGETQINIEAKADDPEQQEYLHEWTQAKYEHLRAQFPLSDGTVSHDRPRALAELERKWGS